jgi:hypothetical protein
MSHSDPILFNILFYLSLLLESRLISYLSIFRYFIFILNLLQWIILIYKAKAMLSYFDLD